MDNNFTDEIYKTFEKFVFEEVSYTNLDLVVSSVKEIFDRYKNIIKPTIEIKTKIDKAGNIINFYFEDNGKVIEDLNDLYI